MTYHESLIKALEQTKNCMHGISYSLISKTLWLGLYFLFCQKGENCVDKWLRSLSVSNITWDVRTTQRILY